MFNNISYNVVVERFKAFADGHFLIRRFTHGQVDQTDLDKDQLFPWMHVAPVEVRAAAGARVFTFDVIFADIPRDKEDKTDYQKESISDCIRLAEDLLSEIQNGQVVFSDLVEVEGESTITPFIEEWTHTLSGCTLALTISVPNDYNACDIPADWSIGGGGGGTPPSPFPPLILKVNNIDNVVQNILNVVDGENTTIEDLGDGRVRINSTGGGGGAAVWGAITGTLSSQTDLQTALNLKANISSLGAVAFSNDYNDLDNLPTIPAAQVNSDWNASSGVAQILNKPTIPAAQVNADWNAVAGVAQILNKPTLAAVATSGDYNDLSNLPTIPAAQIQSDWTQTNTAALDYIKNKPTLPATVGDMLKSVYDTDDDGIVDFAESMKTEVRNSTGATLYKGHIVYLSGSTGNLPNAVLAQANNDANSAQTFGVIYADIANNSDGFVITLGQINTLDTRSTAPNAFTSDTLVDGDVIYLSPTTPGHVTRVKPVAPQHIVYVGMVVRTSPTNGTIQYRIQNGYELDELHNVVATSPADNDYMYYDASTSLYRLRQLTAALITDTTTVGQSMMKLTNPSAVRFLRINADNSVTARTAAEMVTDLGIVSGTFTILGQSQNASTIPASSTYFGSLFSGAATIVSADNVRRTPMVTSGTLSRLYVQTSAAQPATGSLVCTVRKNSVDQALTLTIAAGSAAGVFTDLVNTVSVVAGDLMGMKFQNNATTVSANVLTTQVQLTQ